MTSVKCLSCGEKIVIDFKPLRGTFIECDECGNEFKIISVNPLKIGWDEYDDSEDRDYDFDEEDEEDY